MDSAVEKRYSVGTVGTVGCGPYMTLVLTLSGDSVVEAKYATYPCPAAHACGEYVTDWAIGKRLQSLSGLTTDQIERSVGKMPLGREHCPALAVNALADLLARERSQNTQAAV